MDKIQVEIDKDLEPIFDSFLGNRKKDLDMLNDAISSSDFKTVETIGHKLAGNAGSYGLPDLGHIGGKLEDCAISQEIEKIKALYQDYKDYINNLEIKFV